MFISRRKKKRTRISGGRESDSPHHPTVLDYVLVEREIAGCSELGGGS